MYVLQISRIFKEIPNPISILQKETRPQKSEPEKKTNWNKNKTKNFCSLIFQLCGVKQVEQSP